MSNFKVRNRLLPLVYAPNMISDYLKQLVTLTQIKRLGLALMLMLSFALTGWGQTTRTWTNGNGNFRWTTPNNWSGNTVPGVGDNVIINITGTITRVPTLILNSLSIGADVTLIANGAARTLTINNSTGVTSFYVATGNTLTMGDGTAGNAVNLTLTALGAASNVAGNIFMTANTTLAIQTTTLNITGNLSGAGNVTMTTGTLNIAGSFSNTGTFTCGTGTVNYNSAAQTVRTVTYYNLTLSGSGAKTTTGVTVNNILSMEGMATATATPTYAAAATLQYKGSNLQTTGIEFPATFDGAGGVIINNSNGVNLGGSVAITNGLTLTSGTFAVGANTLTLNGPAIAGTPASLSTTSASNLVFGGSSAGVTIPSSVTQLNNLTINNASGVTLNSSITINGALTLTSGALNLNGNTLTIAASGSFTCGGAGTINGNAGSTFVLNGATATNLPAGTYQNLTINRSGGITLCGNTTINGTLTLTSGTFAVTGNTLTLNGPPIAGTPASLSTTSASNLVFGGSSAGVTIPSSVTQLNNLTINNASGVTLNVSLTINGILTLTSGILSLGSNNLTLSSGASTTGTFSSTSMIDIGTGIVIKEGNANPDFILTFPIGHGTAYTPLQIADFSGTTIAPTSTIKLQSYAAAASGAPGTHPLNRNWVTSTTGISGSVLADVRFTYTAGDIPPGGIAGLYEIVYQPTLGTWALPSGASAAGSNPLRASSATTLDATWTGTEPIKRVFYSLKTGSWDDPATWTLDPSGTQPLNPNNVTPTTSATWAFDEVVVLSGRTITVPTNTKVNNKLTVIGTVDFGTTTGHSFNYIYGTGRIRLAADNFPTADASDFITAGQGEGTVEYYGTTRSLSTSRTFYNVDINMTVGNTLTLLKDYTINGNLTITNGTLSINDNLATTAININVFGNMLVTSAGKIITGTANARHQLNLYGDFTNSGEVRFTNRGAADYANEAPDGIVDVNFLSTDKSQSIMCRGITNFYRIEIDKGTDYTYTLNIDATAIANFNLFGYANEDHSADIPQLTYNNNALGLVRGTVRIGNSIVISTLSTANVYCISQGAQLWVDRGTVQKNSGKNIAIYGKLKITNGLLEAKTESGITFRDNGILSAEGGTVNVNQIRTSDVGSNNYGGYVQTAGTVNVLGGTTNTDYYVFSLPYGNSVFNMSGGTLNVNTCAGNGGILINSDPDNVKVTGGMVVAETKSTEDFLITSTASFWNLSFKNSTAVARQFTLGAATNIGPDNVNVTAQPLKVLNDFRIWGAESGGATYPAITFTTGKNDVYIGGSFYVENGAKYVPISGGISPYDASANQPTVRNTTYFNKTTGTGAVEEFYQGDATNPLELGNIVVDRTNGYEVKMTSGAARTNESVVLDINGNASVLSGTLNQNLFTIRTWGAITNNDRMGTWYPGVTPSHAQIQLVENPALTLTTTTNAVFGNVQINVTPPSVLTLTSDVYIERMEYVKGLIYLKSYNLKVDNLWNMETGIFENSSANSYMKVGDSSYSGSSMIYTDGKASDGGLSIKVTANSQAENQPNILNNFGPITFPLGFTTDGGTTRYFRPAQMVVKNFSSSGYITIRPILGALQTTNQTGATEVLQHYWRVSHSGFTTLPTVAYRFYYRNQKGTANVDLPAGAVNEALYVPGKVLDESPYTRQYEPLADNDVVKAFGAGGNSRSITINGTSTNGMFSPSSAGVTLENANYSTGVAARFTGSVLIYYSIDNVTVDWNPSSGNKGAPWNSAASWTRSDILNPVLTSPHNSSQPQSTTIPGAGDVVVIGWVPWDDPKVALRGQPHCIWLTDSRQVAEVVFTKMTDAGGNPVARVYRSNFQFRPTLTINGINDYDGINGTDNGILTAKLVKGEGLFWDRQSDPDYTIMDVGDFARQDSSYVIYENFTDNRIINNTPALFPNIYISNDNWGGNNWNFTFARNITTTGNVELLGDVNLVLPTGATGDFNVGRNLVMFENNTPSASGGGAEIDFGNLGTARKFIIKGDLLMKNSNSIIEVITPNATAPLVDHELHVYGNIVQGTGTLAPTGLDLWSGANNDRITLYLDGSSSMTYTRNNGTIPDLYRVVVNKGTSQATTAQFNTDFVLNGPTSGVSVKKALELQNGTFIYNNTNTTRTLNLTTGNDNFDIPSTAGLDIRQGTARASGTSGINLDGKLTISGGTLNMSGGDNPIEYSASGSAAISVTNGNLIVGGQIRRSISSDVGILSYNQTGGTVVAGNDAATFGNRGVFEILNAGSSFTMSGGDLYIARAQTSPTISAFYFDPASYNVGLAANIHIGCSTTPASQTIGIYANKPLPRLRVDNSGTLSPKVTAKLEVVPATITSLLQIDAGTTLNANGLDLTLKGDMTSLGTFTPNSNTTYLSGSSAQNITGNGTALNFYNLDKTTSNLVTLNAANTPLLVLNALSLSSGIFRDNGNTVTVRGDVYNNATHENNGTGDGIVMNGTTPQTLTGNGIFGKLTINNLNGVNIPIGNQLQITRSLKMQSGVLNIGKNLLDLGVNALIEEASPFSNTNMVETNISFTDNGLRKTFPMNASPIFTFPVGSNDKYTPVTITISANGNSTGSITVKPANEMHPSIIEDTETGTPIVDKDNALQYYWTLKSSGITGFSAVTKMRYIDTDAKVTTPYTLADYFTASILSNGLGNWLKFPNKDDFDEVNKDLIFNFTLKGDADISGDYTAGAGDASLDGAIPDQVSKYETNSSGNWTTSTIWTPNVASGPRGAIAKINALHTVDVTDNNLAGYMTEVYGTLKLYSTSGHRLGILNGTGTLYLEIGDIPAAVYDEFFSSAGGTIEFGGTSKNYEFLGNITEVNNLTLSGTGDRKLPNNILLLNGNLIISGGNVLNYYNRKMSIKGDVLRSGGAFDAGSGPYATIALIGTLNQTITGPFSNANALNNLEINNTNDVNIINDVEVDRELKLTNGLVNITPGNLFRLNYGATVSPAAGTALSFVNGVLTKELMNGNSFTFPIGNYHDTKAHGPITLQTVTGPSGINDWKASYFYANATLAGYNTESFYAPISTVSHSEYWKIEAPTGGASVINITLDGSSDVASSLTNLSDLRVVGWNATTSKWEIVGSGSSVSGTATSGSITTTGSVNYGSYSFFTLASITPVAASTATITSPGVVNLCNGSSTTIVVTFTGDIPYVLTYTAGASTITTPAINSSSFPITVSPSTTTVYTLTKITANGIDGTITGTTSTTVNVSPIPTVLLSSTPVSPICEGASITFTTTAGLSNYRFRVNGTTAQNGTSNTYTTTLAAGIQSVDVIGTNAGGCSATSSALAVTVNPKPDAAGVISGSVSVCRSSPAVYSVPAITNATSYSWSYSGTNTTITGSGTSVTLNFGATATSGVLTVYGKNSCGNGVSSNLSINVSSGVAVTQKQNISTGPTSVCQGTGSHVYTVPVITDASGYKWYYSGNGVTELITGTAVSSGGFVTSTNTITLNYSSSSTTGNLTVKGVSGCPSGDGPLSDNYSITVSSSPTATLSPLTPSTCSGTAITITATPAGGTTPYITHAWTGTGASSLTPTNTTNPSFNNATGGSYDLTYTVTDTKGCTGSASTTVTVFQAPVSEAGPDALNLCTGASPIVLTGSTASGSYSGTPTWTGSGGAWTQNPDPALATFTPSTVSGSTTATLTLTGANGCSSVTDTRTISWSKTPDQPADFTVSSVSICQGQSGVTYTVPNDPIVVTYNWTYTVGAGATISGSGNSITINFSAAATTGKLNVTATNACGTSIARTLDITVNSSPAASILTGNTSTCAGSIDGFSVTPDGTWTYLWSVEDALGTVNAPGNTSAVTVSWKNNAGITWPALTPTTVEKKVRVEVNTTPVGCPQTLEWSVTIHRVPETGPQYHVPNTFGF